MDELFYVFGIFLGIIVDSYVYIVLDFGKRKRMIV